ncbi:unnamed protein product [Caenorhabditis brenneri]
MGALFSVIAASKKLLLPIFGPPVSRSFPIFRLPGFALCNVLQCFELVDLYLLAQCSPSARETVLRTVKFSLAVNSAQMNITLNDANTVQVAKNYPEETVAPYCFQLKNLKGFTVYPEHKKLIFRSGSARFKDLNKIAHHMKSVLLCPISYTYLNWQMDTTHPSIIPEIEKLTRNSTEPLGSLRLRGNFSEYDLQWVFDTIKVTNVFELWTTNTENIRLDFPTGSEFLVIRPATLISFENLARRNSCRFIELAGSGFSTSEINDFMNLWRTGRFPNLEHIAIQTSFDPGIQIFGFSMDQMKQIGNIVVRKSKHHRYFTPCNGGVEVESDYGIKAVMQISEQNVFKLAVQKN